MPRGVFIHAFKPYNLWNVRSVGCIIHIGVGFCVARFDKLGNSYSL